MLARRKIAATSYTKLYTQFKAVKLNQTPEQDKLEKQKTLFLRSQLYFREGHYDSALVWIAEALQLDPTFIDAYFLQSQILDNKGDAVEAVKCLLTALLAVGLSAAHEDVIERLRPYSIISIHNALTSLPADDRRFLKDQFFDENTALGRFACQRIAKDKHLEKVQAGLNYYKLLKQGVGALFNEKIDVAPIKEFHLQEDIVIPIAINFC